MTYRATLDHIHAIAAKRDRLEAAQTDAESQFLLAVSRDHQAGCLSDLDLARVYVEWRGSALVGFSKRWSETVAVSPARLLRVLECVPPPDGWHGNYPFDGSSATPVKGVSVVYVLFDSDGEAAYVGSTRAFRQRMRQHARAGKAFVRWQAVACATRAEAYALERRWLAQHLPYLNLRPF